MQWFRITTLVDITRTQVFKEHIDPLKKRQQDNYNTLHQTLEMRAIIFSDSDPKRKILEWNGKKELTWIWEFYIERDDIFLKDNDPAYLIRTDLEYVPFINNCEETAEFENFFFSINKNIKVEFISS
jgi:hypothetical protein